MKPILALGLFTVVTVSSIVQLPELSIAAPARQTTTTKRDVFYTSQRFGFRFISPNGYTIVPVEKPSGKPTPLQVLEIWNPRDYQNRRNLPESPPIISITTYNNSQKLPLTKWKGELSRNDDRALTVAGQPAIAYTSTGLYEYDNVLFSSRDRRYVFRLQVGYINKSDRLRQVFQQVVNSFTFGTVSSSTPAPKLRSEYNSLQNLLNARNWQAADVETRAILSRLAGSKGDILFDSKTVLNQLPCEDLRTIDNLWSNASQKRFGYTAQQRIWQQTRITNSKQQVEKFGQAVGWRRSQPLPQDNPVGLEISGTEWKLDTELNYTANAPVGHFPWVGVSSSLLSNYLSERSLGCGSCTIDAINLASDRFYNYIPALFNRVKVCQVKTA